MTPVSGVGDSAFGISDFKSLASAQLVPKRLTVLCGANSSGKSSLLQAVLLFAQSFGEPSVVINGDLVRLGEGIDVIKGGADSTTVDFQFDVDKQVERQGETSSIERHRLRLTLDSPQGRSGLALAALSLLVDDKLVLDVKRTPNHPDIAELPGTEVLAVSGEADDDPDLYVFVSGITPIQFAYRVSPETTAEIVYKVLERTGMGRLNILQQITADSNDPKDLELLETLKQRFSEDEIVNRDDPALGQIFDRSAALIVPDSWLTAPIAFPSSTPAGIQVRFHMLGGFDYMPEKLSEILAEIALAYNRAQHFAESTLYLGPLRDDPRVAYPLGHTVGGLPVGEKGEFTAAYLLDNASETVRYCTAKGSNRTASLSSAVTEWCTYLGIADAVEVEPMGKLGHKLRLKVAGALRDPTAIGVGASQLLPVVALVLGAPSGSVILLEQPELHLHPKVQSRLADFFIRARPDVRLVVETHSENLVTRLRRRVAEQAVSPGEVNVLFAAQRARDDDETVLMTEFRTLSIDELGNFDYWPENFFDSLDDDGAALAKAVSARIQTN